MTERKWQGKSFYAQDVATKKHVDRVQDRLDRRIDLHGDKVERLKSVQIALERELTDLRLVVEKLVNWEDIGDEE